MCQYLLNKVHEKLDTCLMSYATQMLSGKWLKIWIEIGAVLLAIGWNLVEQVEGTTEIGFLLKFVKVMSTWFNTPWLLILLWTAFSLGLSYMSYTDMISLANFLHRLGMLLEFLSFLWLWRKFPPCSGLISSANVASFGGYVPNYIRIFWCL